MPLRPQVVHGQAFGGENMSPRPQVAHREGRWGREQAFSPRSCAAWFCRVAITPAEGRYRTQRDLKRQETFAKVFRKLWQIRSEEALGAWIYKIATNEINRFFKRKRIILVSEELPEAAIAPEEVDERKAAEILIPKAIGKLTQLEREVFCLKYYEDMDYEQISHITGANKNTLMVIWHNAKK